MTPGLAWQLGARADATGVNFAVFSAHASAIELCLFDASGTRELQRIALPERSGDIWHGRLEGATPGLVYAYRAHGAWLPERGHRFDADLLLLDPYARDIAAPATATDRSFKARIVAPSVDAAPIDAEPRPHRALAESVLYEAHVKGLTKLHPGVPAALRGSYAGLACDAVIEHLLGLGVTAVSLLPVQQFLDEPRLVAQGLSNYWGYNTIGFFAVEPRYASGHDGLSPRQEFRAMVRRLHAAGIEVILDVVYNHTAESDLEGPTLCWRGLDNLSYYRSLPGAPGVYDNVTGCGNALDLRHPRVLQLVMDSLRHWAQTMNVDGFRFDLAPVLGRGDSGFDSHAPFFHAVAQDPVLAGLKLIAEPWDIGTGGYQLGRFPRGWGEWNDRFRDGMRCHWLGAASGRGEFAQRLCASAELFEQGGRDPAESVNFIVAHDGFTLRDLLSYERRHNEANGEHNRDGHATNHGWNCGVEGPTTDPRVLALRSRLERALLATLLLAQGTPMLAAGAELGHTQQGNNNAYCQDNETSWIAWERADASLVAFTSRLIALRRLLQPLHRHWYHGTADASGLYDLVWLRPDGSPPSGNEWNDPGALALGALFGGRWLTLANAEADDLAFALPDGRWQILIDSARDAGGAHDLPTYPLLARSLVLLQRSDAV